VDHPTEGNVRWLTDAQAPYSTGKGAPRPNHVIIGATLLVMRAPMAAVVESGWPPALRLLTSCGSVHALTELRL
jgi:hypothetical protein